MIQNSIDRSCNEQAFVKFLLALTKIPVPTVAFPLAFASKKRVGEKCQARKIFEIFSTQSVVENGIIFTDVEKLYFKTIFCTVNVA